MSAAQAAVLATAACAGVPEQVEDDDPPLATELAPVTRSLGPFSIALATANGAALRVTHDDVPGHSVWETRPGEPFVSAARGEEAVASSSGSFTFDDVIRASCDRQTIDAVERRDGDEPAVVVTGELTGEDCRLGYELRFEVRGERRLGFELELDDVAREYNRVHLRYASSGDERFFGFGTQYSKLDLKGERVPIWVSEQGIGRGAEPLSSLVETAGAGVAGDWHTTYAPMPYYMTSEWRSLLLESHEYAVFDLTEPDVVDVEVWSRSVSGQVLAAGGPREVIEALTEVTGRMQPLPPWTQSGAVVRAHGGADEVLARIGELERAGVPVAAVWIEDWVGERSTFAGTRLWWNWEPDGELYPEWDQLLADLDARGIRVLVYFNPYLVDASDKPSVRRHLFAEAKERGHLVTEEDGGPYLIDQGGFEAGLVDLASESARTWLRAIVKDHLQRGVSGFMADFGEGLPYHVEVASGAPGSRYHNQYPVAWAELCRSAVRAAGAEGDAVFFTRSGYLQSPGASTLFWLGDQTVTWDDYDGIKTVVKGLVSSGLSGFALNHGDIGGYFSISLGGAVYRRSKELLLRWIELGTFSALFRNHETNSRDQNVQIDTDDDTLAQFARFATLYAALAPYRESLMDEAARTGMPLVRHPLLHYPDDPEVYDLDDQFLFGPDIMVAPVLSPGATSRSLYLPRGSWVHAFSGTSYAMDGGARVEVDAPVGEPPVFYRDGSEAGDLLADALR